MKILVVTEQRQGKWNNASFETLVAAQQIAKDTSSAVTALVIGKGVSTLAGELAAKNVAEVLSVEQDLLDVYIPDGYCVALKQVIESAKPDLVLFPHTYQVRDFAPKLAASLGKGMIGDCIGYRNEGGKLVCKRAHAFADYERADCARSVLGDLLRGGERLEARVVPLALALFGEDEDFHG